MCQKTEKNLLPGFMKPLLKLPLPLPGSKRLRLWELPASLHCPVIGVCLSTTVIRRLISRFHQGDTRPSDYECHAMCVNAAARRNDLSEALQKELESRHELAIQGLRHVKESRETERRWNEAVAKGDIAGLLWAALTHPRTTPEAQESIYRDVHMLQHQAGASVRTDQQAFEAQGRENSLLVRELGKIQNRMTAFASEKLAQIDTLTQELQQARHDAIQQSQTICALSAECQHLKKEALRESGPAGHMQALQRLEWREQMWRRENAQLRQELSQLERLYARTLARPDSGTLTDTDAPMPKMAQQLERKTVLCVGGRTGSLSSYRETIEVAGARFAHHDGGLEHNPRTLDAGLAAADYVICQTGCISHDAYWRVKDYCKRHGKKCLYMENASVTALKRGLLQIAASKEQETNLA